MKTDLNNTQNKVDDIYNLDEYAYERIFKMYKDQDEFFAYNILKTVKIPKDLDSDTFYYIRINGKMSWPKISFDQYGSIQLWWLICLTNGIMNPIQLPEPGIVLKIIKPPYVRDVLNSISSQIG
jgi:hypothetical protein